MEWNAGTNWLMRLVAMLLSLADAAEQAAGRSRRVRRYMLTLLRPTEAAAYRVVAGMARDYGAPIPPKANFAFGESLAAEGDRGDDPDELLRLADRLRALAMALSTILAWADYFARRLCTAAHTNRRDWIVSPAQLTGGHEVPALPAPDTS